MALPLTASLPQSGSIVSRWKLDEASGSRADSVGVNTLTDNNTVLSGTGRFGATAADFESSATEYLSITDASQVGLDLSTNFSFSVWVKMESQPSGGAGMTFFSKMGSADTNESYVMEYRDQGGTMKLRTFFENGSNGDTISNIAKTLTNGTWYHIVCTVTIATPAIKFYVDGVDLGSVTNESIAATSLRNSSANFALGYRDGPNIFPFDGMMQDAVLWNTALTGAEVLSLYRSYSTINYDNATVQLTVGATSSTFAHTVAGNNRLLLVGTFSTAGDTVTGITYDGVAMSQITKRAGLSGEQMYVYGLLNPSTGSNNVVVSSSGTTTMRSHAVSYTGVKQSGLPDNFTSTGATTNSLTTSLTPVADNCWTFLFVRSNDNISAGTNSTGRGALSTSASFDSSTPITPAALYSMTATIATSQVTGSIMVSVAPFVTSATRYDFHTLLDVA